MIFRDSSPEFHYYRIYFQKIGGIKLEKIGIHGPETQRGNFSLSDDVSHCKDYQTVSGLVQDASMFLRKIVAFALVLMTALTGLAQSPDTPEPGSQAAIAEATTEKRFISPWVSYVPEHPTVPSPTDHLGHIAGAPGDLSNTETIYAYYRTLADTSDRVRVEVIGRTEEGRDILLVIVGDEDSLTKLYSAREAMSALADPRRTDESAMEKIVAEQKPFYMLNGGIHSTETGSPEMLMELTYRLAVSETPLIKTIRDAIVVLIIPVAEPDGRDRAVEWFYRHLKGKTDFDRLPPRSPPYWGKYVFHDNNRDGIQRKLSLTRATQDAFLAWHPIVVHDLHESIPLLCIWTGTGPYNINLDPITTTEWHAIAFHEVTTLTSFGMPGVWTWAFGEGWAHIYADSVANNHNAIGRGYETFGNATAETVHRRLDPKRQTYLGKPVTEPEWYRTWPPPQTFEWSLRNNVNYQQTGVLSALQYTALNVEDMMRNFWRRGRNAVKKGETEPPYAVAIPEEQRDQRRLAVLVNLLRAHGIEVRRCRETFEVKEGQFATGTYLVRLDQPYRGYAHDLLIAQKFPADKTPYRPYDDVGWALPFTLGVEVTPIDDVTVRDIETDLLTEDVAYSGKVAGDSDFYLIKDTGQEALLAARFRLADFDVGAVEKSLSVDGTEYPAGSWVIADQPGLRSALEGVADSLGIDIVAVRAAPVVSRHSLDLPRLALLQTWSDTQSAGWLRMVFDDEEVPYTLIMDEDIRAGGLANRFDVIIFPNTDDGLKNIINGIDPTYSPLAYTRTAAYPTHGFPTSSEDITGGLTWQGVQHIVDFVRDGGLLVTLGGASELPLDGGIAKDVGRARVKNVETPGSELQVRFRRPDHPLAYGYPEITSAFRESRPLYSVRHADEGRIVLQWGTKIPTGDKEDKSDDDSKRAQEATKSLVVCGGIKGANEIIGLPAILDIPIGKGRVVAFDFDPIHRYTTLSDFRLVWNIILNWNDLPPTPESRDE
jgi:hypothetical protein